MQRKTPWEVTVSLLDQDDHGDGDDDDPDLEEKPTQMLTKSDWANAGYAANWHLKKYWCFVYNHKV